MMNAIFISCATIAVKKQLLVTWVVKVQRSFVAKIVGKKLVCLVPQTAITKANKNKITANIADKLTMKENSIYDKGHYMPQYVYDLVDKEIVQFKEMNDITIEKACDAAEDIIEKIFRDPSRIDGKSYLIWEKSYLDLGELEYLRLLEDCSKVLPDNLDPTGFTSFGRDMFEYIYNKYLG